MRRTSWKKGFGAWELFLIIQAPGGWFCVKGPERKEGSLARKQEIQEKANAGTDRFVCVEPGTLVDKAIGCPLEASPALSGHVDCQVLLRTATSWSPELRTGWSLCSALSPAAGRRCRPGDGLKRELILNPSPSLPRHKAGGGSLLRDANPPWWVTFLSLAPLPATPSSGRSRGRKRQLLFRTVSGA